jgi:hypothetical protein
VVVGRAVGDGGGTEAVGPGQVADPAGPAPG